MRVLPILFLIFTSVFIMVPQRVCAMERFDIITTRELQTLLQDRKEGKTEFLLINTLDAMIFRDGAIPGSINIPLGHLQENIMLLGDEKNKKIIVYCRGFR